MVRVRGTLFLPLKGNPMASLFPVILCGGTGSRLWPLSRSGQPKQFIEFGKNSLLTDTLARCARLEFTRLIAVSNEEHRFYVKDAVRQLPAADIILESTQRNTAPAIALAAFRAQEAGEGQALLLVLPADHRMAPEDVFVEAVHKALPAASEGRLVTFGITPTAPATGFGYIIAGAALSDGLYAVSRFQEKPDAATARRLLGSGTALWNSGMFLFRADCYLEQLQRFRPDIFDAVSTAWQGRRTDGRFLRPAAAPFRACPTDSIDYAIMERTDRAAVMPLQLHWNDLGSWEAFYEISPHDENGNARQGDVMVEDCRNCYLHSTGRLLAAVGVEDLTVVETRDAVLVARRDRVQDVKRIVQRLEQERRPEHAQHPRVCRPWGSYERLAEGERFQVKRIVVEPGEELSLQKHYHRAEHWVVVGGVAEVTLGEQVRLVTENESIFIPQGSLHRLRNPGKLPLLLIEIQTGSYLGEDDIVRISDAYGRTATPSEPSTDHKETQ